MKKILFFASILFLFASCSKDESSQSPLIGTWIVVGESEDSIITMEFKENNDFTFTQKSHADSVDNLSVQLSGKYSAVHEIMKWYDLTYYDLINNIELSVDPVEFLFLIDGNSMTLTSTENSEMYFLERK